MIGSVLVLDRNDDTIPSASLEIATRPDGSPWVLGMGSYGTVSHIYRGEGVGVWMLFARQPLTALHCMG